jgi:hypothetical protein
MPQPPSVLLVDKRNLGGKGCRQSWYSSSSSTISLLPSSLQRHRKLSYIKDLVNSDKFPAWGEDKE